MHRTYVRMFSAYARHFCNCIIQLLSNRPGCLDDAMCLCISSVMDAVLLTVVLATAILQQPAFVLESIEKYFA